MRCSYADRAHVRKISTCRIRYADRAKQLKTVAEVQENPTDKLIRQLREENNRLKTALDVVNGASPESLPARIAAEAALGEQKLITEQEGQAAIAAAVDAVGGVASREKRLALVEAEQARPRLGVRCGRSDERNENGLKSTWFSE